MPPPVTETPTVFFHLCRTLAVIRVKYRDIVLAFLPAIATGVVISLIISSGTSGSVRLSLYSVLAIAFIFGVLKLQRQLVLGARATTNAESYVQRRQRTRRYTLHLLCVLGIATLTVLPLALLTVNDVRNPHSQGRVSFLFYTLLFVWSYVAVRFSLYFVTQAVDEPMTLRLSWKVTAQSPLLMVYQAALIPLLLIVHVNLVRPFLAGAGCEGLCLGLINKLVFAGALCLFTVSLTLAYETLRNISPFFVSETPQR